MNKLQVIYDGWGEHWLLGTLVDATRGIVFEYSQEAIARGLQLSPMHQPLPRPGAVSAPLKGESYFYGLPGFVADALPDGWGMLLMDRALRKLGREPRSVSVLERLAIVGSRAIGALSFEPADEDLLPAEKIHLKDLAKEVMALQTAEISGSQKTDAQLRHLMQLGGSPQGARPKVLVDFNARTGAISSGIPLAGSATPWLIKFPAESEHRDLTYSFGPGGEHSTSVAGHGKNITRAHLLRVANAADINVKTAELCISNWVKVVSSMDKLVRELPIRRGTLTDLLKFNAERIELLK